MDALADSRLPEGKNTLPEDEEETLQKKYYPPRRWGLCAPKTPHRSPRQAFGETTTTKSSNSTTTTKRLSAEPT